MAGGRRRDPLGRPLGRSFYARRSVVVARAVLGRVLVHDSPQGRVAGVIVETEAYRGADDAASHGCRGRTARNAAMFGPPGHAYVYFTYGMHHCLNLVAERAGTAAAVLVRALEPVAGLELVRRRRRVEARERLARGPGNVARALGLTRAHDGLDLTAGPLWLSGRRARRGGRRTACGPRVGIRVGLELPWRFWLAGHPCVSGTQRAVAHPAEAGVAHGAAGRAAGSRRRAQLLPNLAEPEARRKGSAGGCG
ncbi:MAG: DNA-3-methyladenine glycosylase [Candidatus Eisenbacteria bacterium]|nr:DNA-3-methyladenine glycosylase [Candidatus Eisenbacteria bacterium]